MIVVRNSECQFFFKSQTNPAQQTEIIALYSAAAVGRVVESLRSRVLPPEPPPQTRGKTPKPKRAGLGKKAKSDPDRLSLFIAHLGNEAACGGSPPPSPSSGTDPYLIYRDPTTDHCYIYLQEHNSRLSNLERAQFRRCLSHF